MLPGVHWTGRARGPKRMCFDLLSDEFERPEIEIIVVGDALSLDLAELEGLGLKELLLIC